MIRLKTLTMFGVVSLITYGVKWDGYVIDCTLRTRRAWAIQAYDQQRGEKESYRRDQRQGHVKVMKFQLVPQQEE